MSPRRHLGEQRVNKAPRVFTGPTPEGLEELVPLRDELLAAAEDLRQLRPGEKA